MTPDKPSTSEAREPDAWQYRFCIGGVWLDWREIDQPMDRFAKKHQFNLENGTCEIRALYASPAPQGGERENDEGLPTAEEVRGIIPLSPSPAATGWQPIETAPNGRNILLDYDGNVVIGSFCRLNQYWTDGENYIPTKDIRGWMPTPLTDKRPPMQEDGK